jgi:DNA primase
MAQKRPYVDFAEIKQKVSMPEVLQIFGIADRFTWKGQTLCGVCPLPGHVHGPSPNPEQFKINNKDGTWLWMCFGDCKAGGDVIEFAKAMTGFDDAHIRFWWAEKVGARLTPGKKKEKAAVKKDTACTATVEAATQTESLAKTTVAAPADALKPLRFFLNLDPDVEYLRQRNVSPETIARYGIGLCKKGMLAGYIAMPLFDPHQPDVLVGYLGRWPGEDYDEEDRPRYKLPKDFPKQSVIFGLKQALGSPPGKPLIVTEGAFGMFALVQAGYSAVAVLGSSLGDVQASILIDTGRPIVLMFDGGEAGLHGMRVAAAKLIGKCFVRAVKLSDGQQPDHLSAAELSKVLAFLS